MPDPVLVLDTATAACSAALLDGGRAITRRHEIVGRGHAERLAPMVAALLEDAGGVVPAHVWVGCGPGSFTGLRVGLATAIGLGLGWGVPVRGFASTALIALAAAEDCAVALTGGHGELFVERFRAAPFGSRGGVVSLAPAAAADRVPDRLVLGSGAAALVAARGAGEAREAWPDAALAGRLGETDLFAPRPIYGRPPDARPAAA